MLYHFEKLSKKMDEWGFPSIDPETGFRIIKGVDFEEAYTSGSISFEDDGIYLEYDGKKYKGYMFIKEPYIERYNTYPRFHLTKCTTIQQFINAGRFNQRYEFSNSKCNDLIDKTSRNLYKDEVLNYCGYCNQNLQQDYDDTEGFFESLDKDDYEDEYVQVGIFGYVKDKEKISKAYRQSQKYTCEECGCKSKGGLHNRWWHTHHIDGDKTNNGLKNLKCLCILCHSFIDQTHQFNFTAPRMQKQRNSFVSEYKEELGKLKNKHLNKL